VADQRRPTRSRFTVDTSARHRPAPSRKPGRGTELWAAIGVIAAAALATFIALLITSRPFDPMNASFGPQQTVPLGPSLSPTPKSSNTPTPSPTPMNQASPSTPGGEVASETPDDATIQARIESALQSDPNLSKLDISTLIESGKVTIVGSVHSAELKQRVERTIRAVKGVGSVDNQLVISEATP